MVKKIIKKILYILPLLLGCAVIYGICSGKLGNKIKDVRNAIDEGKNKRTEDHKKNGNTSYPPGKISLKGTFKWYIEPGVDKYDPEHKLPKNGIYGITIDEHDWWEQCAKELQEYNNNHPLSSAQAGEAKYNHGQVVSAGETFELKCDHLTGVFKNITVSSQLSDVEDQYFLHNNAEEIRSCLDAEGNLGEMMITRKSMSEDNNIVTEEVASKVYFVTAEITLKSSCEWVQESGIVPKIQYLIDNGDVITPVSNVIFIPEGDQVSGFNDVALYYDLGFYDFSEPGNINEIVYNYPMRKNEEITFKVGYIIPEEFLDNAYLYYGDSGTSNIGGNSYNNIYAVLIKLT